MRTPRSCGKTVLVVDDDQPTLDLLTYLLEHEGFKVECASDGRQGLEAVERCMPSLILLDIDMPVMTGWEFAWELRARYSQPAPIVVVSACDDIRKWAKEMGVANWVRKPFDANALLRVAHECAGT